MQKTWDAAAISLALAPLGSADGKECRIRPFRNLLTVCPFDDTTTHRLPVGLGMTYLKLHHEDT